MRRDAARRERLVWPNNLRLCLMLYASRMHIIATKMEEEARQRQVWHWDVRIEDEHSVVCRHRVVVGLCVEANPWHLKRLWSGEIGP